MNNNGRKINQEYLKQQNDTLKKENTDSDVEVRNFIVNYSDGSQKIIEKGFFCEMEEMGETDGECNLTFIMVDVSGKELYSIVFGCIQLATQMGWLDKSE